MILALGLDLSVHLCWEHNIKYKFGVPYFQYTFQSITKKHILNLNCGSQMIWVILFYNRTTEATNSTLTRSLCSATTKDKLATSRVFTGSPNNELSLFDIFKNSVSETSQWTNFVKHSYVTALVKRWIGPMRRNLNRLCVIFIFIWLSVTFLSKFLSSFASRGFSLTAVWPTVWL